MRLSILFLTVILILPSATLAGWTSIPVKVKNVIWIPPIKGFYPEETDFDKVGCSPANLYQVAPTVTDLEASRILAMLLAAKAAGTPVTVWVTGSCSTEGPFFNGLQVNP